MSFGFLSVLVCRSLRFHKILVFPSHWMATRLKAPVDLNSIVHSLLGRAHRSSTRVHSLVTNRWCTTSFDIIHISLRNKHIHTPSTTRHFNFFTMPRISGFVRHLVEDELSYNLSRPYGLGKWFKLWVFIGSILVFGFLTIFNLATNGFDKQLRYTTDPNSTEAETRWYNSKIFTWGYDSLDPKCQNTEIPVGHEFITTNLGLRYTVRRILYFPPGSDVEQERSSVSYHNNTLTNCDVNIINIYLKKAEMAKLDEEYRWWSWMDSSADAVARCDITNDDGFFTLEFLVKYDTTDEYYGYIAVNNATSHASFWWGSRLMNAYFVGTKYFMSYPIPDSRMFTGATLTYLHTETT